MTVEKELTKCIDMIDSELKNILNIDNPYILKILDSINYSLFTGGKRIRPILALKSFDIFNQNEDYKDILPFAIAIEMIHTYSLIHDDLPSMDDDDFRRGKPTNHKVYGEAMAILSGDGLLNLAFETMISSCDGVVDINVYRRNLSAIKNIGKYSGLLGMIGGQVVDLYTEKQDVLDNELLYMYKSKTAALIEAATVSGSIIGGASNEEIEIMREFGYCLGMAYQIKDDILDISEDESIDKLTYLSHFGLERGLKDLEKFSKRAKEQLELLKGKDINFFSQLTDDLNDRRV